MGDQPWGWVQGCGVPAGYGGKGYGVGGEKASPVQGTNWGLLCPQRHPHHAGLAPCEAQLGSWPGNIWSG